MAYLASNMKIERESPDDVSLEFKPEILSLFKIRACRFDGA